MLIRAVRAIVLKKIIQKWFKWSQCLLILNCVVFYEFYADLVFLGEIVLIIIIIKLVWVSEVKGAGRVRRGTACLPVLIYCFIRRPLPGNSPVRRGDSHPRMRTAYRPLFCLCSAPPSSFFYGYHFHVVHVFAYNYTTTIFFQYLIKQKSPVIRKSFKRTVLCEFYKIRS